MIQNTFQAYAMGMTTVVPVVVAPTFTVIAPIKGQVGIALWTGSTGIEIAGAGMSYGAQSFTLINGVTQTLQFMNSNGSSLLLAPNGSGLPIFNTILAPISFAGAPQLWLTAAAVSLAVRVTYFFNDAFQNQ